MKKESIAIALAALAAAGSLVAIAALTAAPPARAAALLYPDLKTTPPSELRLETVVMPDGAVRNLLRFSNTVWNAGQGPIELRGSLTSNGTVTQNVYDDSGAVASFAVGQNFTFHEGHNHWHFDDFAEYQLWTKSAYDAWVASGRSIGQAQRVGSKSTFCLMDTKIVQSLPGTPGSAVYRQCGLELQGISVGWGDTYRYYLADQWIDLGASTLADGTYVLRSVADPKNRLFESANRADESRESLVANEAITTFTVQRGRLKLGGGGPKR
jgi:Lysyl oxidase